MPVLKHTQKAILRAFQCAAIILFWLLIIPDSWGQVDSVKTATQDPKDVVEYWAEDIYLRVDSNVAHLVGEAKVVNGSMTLTAHRIVLDLEAKTVCAFGRKDSLGQWEGRPVFDDGGQSFTQDELCYNFDTKKGLSRAAVTTEQDIVFHADRAKRQPDETVHVRDGKFTTCDAENPHFHFHLTKAIMVPDEKVVSGPLYLKFRKVPTPLALPFGWFPMSREKRSQGILLPGYGDGGNLGFFLKDLGYYLPLGDHWDAKFFADLYSGGSWAVRTATSYKHRYRSEGGFSLSFQRQRQGFAGAPGFGMSNNFFVRWNHNQDPRARPNTRFNASVNFGSSGNFQQNLNSSQQEFLSNTFQSSLQWNAQVPRSPFSATVSARHSQNSNTGNVQITLPSLSVNMQRSSLSKLMGLRAGKSKVLDNVAVTYSTQLENTISGADTTFGAQRWSDLNIRNGLKHSAKVTSSSSVGFVSLTPSFQYNQYDSFATLSRFEAPVGGDSTAVFADTLSGYNSTGDWRLSVSANTRFYGLFNVKGEGRLKAIRHVMSPTLGLSYNPERTRVEAFETAYGESVSWNPYSLGRFAPNDLREAGSVTFGLGHNLEAKVADRETGELRKVKLIDNLTTSGSYNMVADSLRFSDLRTRAFTSLFNKVNVNMNATHSMYGRDRNTGDVVDEFVWVQGNGLLRLKRLTGALGTSFKSGSESNTPWNARVDYNVNLRREWNAGLERDTSVVTHSLSARGGLSVLGKHKLDVQTGYDLERREITPTNLNFYIDLHCWELTFNWIPFGIRQSFSLRINVKSTLLRDLKLEARGSSGQLLF